MKRSKTSFFSILAAVAAIVSATTASGISTTYTFDVLDYQVGSGEFSFTLNPAADYPVGTLFSLDVNGVTSILLGTPQPWDPATSYLRLDAPHEFVVYLFDSNGIGSGVSNYLPDHSSPWTGQEVVDGVAAAPQLRLKSVHVPDSGVPALMLGGLWGTIVLLRRPRISSTIA